MRTIIIPYSDEPEKIQLMKIDTKYGDSIISCEIKTNKSYKYWEVIIGG